MRTALLTLLVAPLGTLMSVQAMPYVFHFCKPFHPPHTLHVEGISPMNLPDFVIQLNKNAAGMSAAKWGEREKYEVPFHIHFYFKHPAIPARNQQLAIALGPGIRHGNWDRTDWHGMWLRRGQRYHIIIRAIATGYRVEINGRVVATFGSNRRFGNVNAGYVTWTKADKIYAGNGNTLAPCPRASSRRRKPAKKPVRRPSPPRRPPSPPSPAPKPSPPAQHDDPDGDEDEDLDLPPVPGYPPAGPGLVYPPYGPTPYPPYPQGPPVCTWD